MNITPDWSEGTGLEQIPAGVYNARIDSFQEKKTGPNSNTPDTPYLNWKLVIFGAEGEAAVANNRPVFLMTFPTVDKDWAKRRINNFVASALAGEKPATLAPADLIGRELQVILADKLMPDGTPGIPEVKAMRPIKH